MIWHMPMLPVLLSFALLEEVVFRSGIHESFLRKSTNEQIWRKRMGAISMPNFSTAILFMMANGVFRTWIIAAFAFPVGLALGILYERYRRVWICVVAHSMVNATWFLLAPWFGVLQDFF